MVHRARSVLGLPHVVLRNLLAKTLSEIPIKLIRLAMLVLAARWLGRSEFGIYSYAVALGYMLVQFADLGLQFHLARMVSRELVPRILPDAEHLISYHILISGSCWGGPEGEPQVHMKPGDVTDARGRGAQAAYGVASEPELDRDRSVTGQAPARASLSYLRVSS